MCARYLITFHAEKSHNNSQQNDDEGTKTAEDHNQPASFDWIFVKIIGFQFLINALFVHNVKIGGFGVGIGTVVDGHNVLQSHLLDVFIQHHALVLVPSGAGSVDVTSAQDQDEQNNLHCSLGMVGLVVASGISLYLK